MARQPRAKAVKETNADTIAFLAALKSVVSIQKGSGLTERQSHCMFTNGFVVATNDVQIVGCPIKGVAFQCCPHSKTLLAAIERCTGELTFTLEANHLTVKSGRIRVPVPCLEPAALIDLCPDMPQGQVPDCVRPALGVVASAIDESEERPIYRSVFFGPNTAQATCKGHYVLQYWHGVENLPEIAIPKTSAVLIASAEKTLTSLGMGSGTATFWFEDDSFIRTRLIDAKSPNFDKILNQQSAKQIFLSKDFFENVKTMLPFSKDSNGQDSSVIVFDEGHLWAGKPAENIASFEYETSPFSVAAFNGDYLLSLQKHFGESASYEEYNRKLYFMNGPVRGALMGLQYESKAQLEERLRKAKEQSDANKRKQEISPAGYYDENGDWCEDIPF